MNTIHAISTLRHFCQNSETKELVKSVLGNKQLQAVALTVGLGAITGGAFAATDVAYDLGTALDTTLENLVVAAQSLFTTIVPVIIGILGFSVVISLIKRFISSI